MKVRSKKDSTGYKKISLIDEFGLNMSYNMAAKVRPLSDLNMRVRLKLTKTYTFSMNAVFATYAYEFDENGNVRVGEKTEYSQGRFGRFQGMTQNLSYTFNNQTFRKLLGLISKSHRNIKPDDKDKDDDEEDDDEDEDETDPEMQNVDPERKRGRMGTKAHPRRSAERRRRRHVDREHGPSRARERSRTRSNAIRAFARNAKELAHVRRARRAARAVP